MLRNSERGFIFWTIQECFKGTDVYRIYRLTVRFRTTAARRCAKARHAENARRALIRNRAVVAVRAEKPAAVAKNAARLQFLRLKCRNGVTYMS